MKTAVSVPDPLFTAADELAEQLGLSRSALYSRALESFVKAHDDESVTARLNEVYGAEPSALDPRLESLQARSIAKSPWK